MVLTGDEWDQEKGQEQQRLELVGFVGFLPHCPLQAVDAVDPRSCLLELVFAEGYQCVPHIVGKRCSLSHHLRLRLSEALENLPRLLDPLRQHLEHTLVFIFLALL